MYTGLFQCIPIKTNNCSLNEHLLENSVLRGLRIYKINNTACERKQRKLKFSFYDVSKNIILLFHNINKKENVIKS